MRSQQAPPLQRIRSKNLDLKKLCGRRGRRRAEAEAPWLFKLLLVLLALYLTWRIVDLVR